MQDIIAEVFENLREHAEPLSKMILPPSSFHVYLQQGALNVLKSDGGRIIKWVKALSTLMLN